jgi:hypothetical protein
MLTSLAKYAAEAIASLSHMRLSGTAGCFTSRRRRTEYFDEKLTAKSIDVKFVPQNLRQCHLT